MKIIEKIKIKYILPLLALIPFSMPLVSYASDSPFPIGVNNYDASKYVDIVSIFRDYYMFTYGGKNSVIDFDDAKYFIVFNGIDYYSRYNDYCYRYTCYINYRSGFTGGYSLNASNHSDFATASSSGGSYSGTFCIQAFIPLGDLSNSYIDDDRYIDSYIYYNPLVMADPITGDDVKYNYVVYVHSSYSNNGIYSNWDSNYNGAFLAFNDTGTVAPITDLDFNGHSNGFDYSDYLFVPDISTADTDPGWLKKIFNLLGKVNNNIVGSFAQLNNNFNGLLAPLYTQINDAIDTISSPITSLVDTVLNGFQDIGDRIDYFFEPLRLNDVIDAFYNTTVGGLVSSVDGFLDGFRDAFYNATEPDTLVFDIPYDFINIHGTIHIDFAWYKNIKIRYLNVFLTFLVMGFGIHILKTLPGVLGGMPKERSNK